MSAFTAAAGNPYELDPAIQVTDTPFWRESLAGAEWAALHVSPVYYGCVERGQGEPVVVVPGFMGNDLYLSEMFLWLRRIGYAPYFSGIDLNIDCPDTTADQLLATVSRAQRETGQKVRLIGHSLGGMLARSIAQQFPTHVSAVISLGSPFNGVAEVHPIIPAATEMLRGLLGHRDTRNLRPSCFSGHCMCDFVRDMMAPGEYSGAHFAIYSKTDGVVHWENCAEEDDALNDEVQATHMGMAWNANVYRVIARRLAQARAMERAR
jgi:triacylglycerol lipase